MIWGYFSPQFFLCGHACEGWPLFFPLSNGDFSMTFINIFDIKSDIEHFGVWYALHTYGLRQAWSIWVATRMIKRDRARLNGMNFI